MDRAETVRVGREVVRVPKGGKVVIDPPSSTPARAAGGADRYSLPLRYVGVIERLAGTRYDVASLRPDDVDRWQAVDLVAKKLNGDDQLEISSALEVIDPLAQSVLASTEIEGEGVYAEDIELAIVGQAPSDPGITDEYEARRKGAQSVYASYIWALSQPFPLAGNQVINTEFLVELHRRLFSVTKPSAAGRFKQKPVKILWGGYIEIATLEPDRTPEFIARLCDRINGQFMVAHNSGRASRLLATAEFLVDFLAIHPFSDGNGRTARLLSTYLLERAGYHFARFYSLDTIILDRRTDYYRTLFESQSSWYLDVENISPWIEFYLDAVFEQWLRAHSRIMSDAKT